MVDDAWLKRFIETGETGKRSNPDRVQAQNDAAQAQADRQQAQHDMAMEIRRQREDPYGTGTLQRFREKLDADRRAVNESIRRANGGK